ncbi:hypothetical protein AAL_04544 [Moelleriella libera RCEF 2490]|uniref:Uncharacterized protein n=1 Tax=Moelleriella libera RCEF 2490 TaxID=1081109 RepID=A0A162ILX9_9HYPO|nr:hypothetical protein AAL_04544 [Moelleriella libera RCEF 2490]
MPHSSSFFDNTIENSINDGRIGHNNGPSTRPANNPTDQPLGGSPARPADGSIKNVPDSPEDLVIDPIDGSKGHPLKKTHKDVEGAARVPYSDGLSLGQGYNTYLQTGCMNGAVDITGPTDAPDQVKITYNADQITEYSQIVKELEISASLGIQYLDNSAAVSGKLLDKSTFENSLLTYIVRADVTRQPSSNLKYQFKWNNATNPQERYGDRFISDFVEGGALYAQVSIQTTESSQKEQLQANAKIAFSMYGVDVTVTTNMKLASEFLSNNSKITSEMFWVGAPPKQSKSPIIQELKSFKSNAASLLDIKDLSDKFLAEAGQHQWKRSALVEQYDQIFNWNNEFTPLSYSDAIEQTWAVFDDYASYDIKVPDSLKEKQQQLRAAVLMAKDAVKTWITRVAKDPHVAETKPLYEAPDQFFGNILGNLSSTYTVQSITYQWQKPEFKNHPRSSSLIDQNLRTDIGNVTSLYKIRAFSFPGISGTSKYTFGHIPGMPWWTLSSDAPLPPSYHAQSHLWVLNNKSSEFYQPMYVYDFLDLEKYWWDKLQVKQNSLAPDKNYRFLNMFFTKLVGNE